MELDGGSNRTLLLIKALERIAGMAHKKDYKTGRKPREGWVRLGTRCKPQQLQCWTPTLPRTKPLKSEILDVALLQYLAAVPVTNSKES
jgi:hypothetical protein